MYQVLARKYRPRNFNELVGQNHVSRALPVLWSADVCTMLIYLQERVGSEKPPLPVFWRSA